MLKKSLRTLLKILYRVEVIGLENYYKAGNRVLIISNHCSFLDPPLLAAFLIGMLVLNWIWTIAKGL